MNLATEPYLTQVQRWPTSGRHILAQFDDVSIVVYQAYQPTIGLFAATHGYFGDGFNLERMSWLKTNFLWMMYRSGWGTKPGQEVTLAIRLQRHAFDSMLRAAVPSSYDREHYESRAAWSDAVRQSEVCRQWDPDHDPAGTPLAHRAIQLGLRGNMLRHYAKEWISEIEDISEFVAQQRTNAHSPYTSLMTPREQTYPLHDKA